MIEFVGNCNHKIDWSSVLSQLNNKEPSVQGPFYNSENLDYFLRFCKENKLLLKRDGGTIGWDIFLPDRDFDIDIVKEFAEFVKVKSYVRAWITRIPVGMMIIPFSEFNSSGSKWHCHINDKGWGHTLFVDEIPLYDQAQGNTYKWNHRSIIHSASNVGWEPQYLFNFID